VDLDQHLEHYCMYPDNFYRGSRAKVVGYSSVIVTLSDTFLSTGVSRIDSTMEHEGHSD